MLLLSFGSSLRFRTDVVVSRGAATAARLPRADIPVCTPMCPGPGAGRGRTVTGFHEAAGHRVFGEKDFFHISDFAGRNIGPRKPVAGLYRLKNSVRGLPTARPEKIFIIFTPENAGSPLRAAHILSLA